jgi:hypothetical protein
MFKNPKPLFKLNFDDVIIMIDTEDYYYNLSTITPNKN